jgi:transposase
MKKPYRNKRWLERKLYVENLTCQEIAKICNVYDSTVCRNATKLGLNKNKFSKNPHKNIRWLEYKVYVEKLSNEEIANICCVSIRTIYRHISFLSIRKPAKIKRNPAIVKFYMIRNKKRRGILIDGTVIAYARYVAEKHIRQLKPGEEVHHKDEDTLNDDPENLDILTKEEHARLHIWQKLYEFKKKPIK